MKNAFFFQLLINLLFGLLLLVIGVGAAIAPFIKNDFLYIKEFFTTYSWSIPLIGICIALVAISMLSWTFSLLKKGHYETVTGKTKIWIQEGVFEKAIEEFWHTQLSKAPPLHGCSASVRKNKLHLTLQLPISLAIEQQQELETQLRNYLQQELGYISDFSISLFTN